MMPTISNVMNKRDASRGGADDGGSRKDSEEEEKFVVNYKR